MSEPAAAQLWRTLGAVGTCALLVQSAVATPHRVRTVTTGEWRVSWSPRNEGEDTGTATAVHIATGRRVQIGSNWLVSIVGPVVSHVSHSEEGSSTSLEAVSLRSSGSPADITTLFDATDVRAALLSARPVSEGLGGRTPKTLQEIVDAVDATATRDWSDLLTSFAVRRLEGQFAIVTFGIGGMHGSYDEFNLRIRVPARSRDWFGRASRTGTLRLGSTWGPSTEGDCCLGPQH